jgi:hypothetical protein
MEIDALLEVLTVMLLTSQVFLLEIYAVSTGKFISRQSVTSQKTWLFCGNILEKYATFVKAIYS